MTRFKELRKAKALTQEGLISQFNARYGRNYTAAAISQFENGKRTPETSALIDFADFFECSIDYLLGHDNNNNIDESQQLAPEELALLEAYRKASDRDKNIIDTILKPSVRDKGKEVG